MASGMLLNPSVKIVTELIIISPKMNLSFRNVFFNIFALSCVFYLSHLYSLINSG